MEEDQKKMHNMFHLDHIDKSWFEIVKSREPMVAEGAGKGEQEPSH